MAKFRGEFDVTGDLVLPGKASPLELKGVGCAVRFINAPNDDDGFAPGLIAVVIGDADTMDAAPDALRARLARLLDLVAFSTHSRFKIIQIRRLIEWEPRMKTRQFRAYQIFDPRYPPDPELDGKYAKTAETIAAAGAADFVIEALRLFRAGLLDTQQQDQFQRFWLALEVIAEGRKGTARVPIPCPKCGGELTCQNCAISPLRRPMARQAIRNLISGLVGATEGEKAYRQLIVIRDGLMHGRSPDAIGAEQKEKFAVLVNRIATLAWHSIMSSMPQSVHETPLAIGHRGGHFAVKELRVGPHGSFDCDTSTDYPSEDKIPSVTISMQTGFRADGA